MITYRLLKRLLVRLPAAGLAALLASAIADPAAARRDREDRRDETALSRTAGTPLMAVVALGEQRVTIYDADGRIMRAPVSSGQRGYETPAGIYSIIQKNREHYSNLYDDAEMPFMQRITWSGIAFHAGALPGRPASHGCVRLPYGFAERLFDMSRMGMRVVVMPRDATPVAIAHPALFKPQPISADVATARPGTGDEPQKMRLGGATPDANAPPSTVAPGRAQTLRSIADAKAAEAEVVAKKADAARLAASKATKEAARIVKAQRLADAAKQKADAQLMSAGEALEAAGSPAEKERAEEAKAKAAAKAAEAQAQVDAVGAEAQALSQAAERAREEARTAEAAKVVAAGAAKEAATKMLPVSVFISRQTQKLYVRQAFQPLFESPVTVRDAEQSIGTHIYTALDYSSGGADVRWSALTMTKGQGRDADEPYEGRRYRNAGRQVEPAATSAAGARAALDRIAIPQEAVDRISEVVSPGSSLIISDEPISRETGKGTDFIVVMSGEPQGGIKIRRRPQPGDYERGYRRSPYGRSPYWGGRYYRW